MTPPPPRHVFRFLAPLVLCAIAGLAGCGGGGGATREGAPITPAGAARPLAAHLTAEDAPNHTLTLTWEQLAAATRYDVLRRVDAQAYVTLGGFSCPTGTTLASCAPRFTDASLAAAGAVTGSQVGYVVRAYAGDTLLDQSTEASLTLATAWGPSFRGGVSATGATTETITVPPALAWSVNLEGPIVAAPAVDVAAQTIFVGTALPTGAGVLWAIPLGGPTQTVDELGNPTTQLAPKWRYTTAGAFVASPTVADGLVFAASRDNTLYALDKTTGALRWQFFAQDDLTSSPTVAYGRVLVGAGNPTPGATSLDNTLYCLDAFPDDNGDGLLNASDHDEGLDDPPGVPYDLLWKVTTQGPVAASPSVKGGLVVAGAMDDRLYLVDIFTGVSRTVDVGSDVVATAAIATAGAATAALVGTRNQFMAYGLNGVGAAPTLLWQMAGLQGDVLGSAAVGDGVVIFPVASQTTAAANKLYAVSLTQGQAAPRWTVDSPDQTLLPTSPLVAGDKVFFGTGNPATANPNGKITALSLATGAVLWQEQVGAAVASPVLVGGLLLFGANTGVLRAYRSP